MYLEDYCSEFVRKIYDIAGSLNGEYSDGYLYSINDDTYVSKIGNVLKEIKPSNKDLIADSGFVFDFNCNDYKGYIVVQSIFDNKARKLSDTLRLVSDYVEELEKLGFKGVMIIDSYSELENTLYTFDLSFILEKERLTNE